LRSYRRDSKTQSPFEGQARSGGARGRAVPSVGHGCVRPLRDSCVFLLLALTSLGASGGEPKRVLFIHSFGRGFEPYHAVAGLLRTELASRMGEPIDFFETSLESARFTSLEQESPLLGYLQAQFAGYHLDLVVPIGGPEAQFVQRHRQQLFPETPMLAAVDQSLFNPSNLTTNDAAALTVNEPGLTLEMLLRVLPETTNVVVVMGNSAIERFWSAQIRRELQPYTNGVSFVWLDELPFSEMLKHCATLPSRSAIFFPLLFVDAAGAGLWRLDLATRCFWVTKKTRELFGFGEEEVVTFDRFMNLVHPEDQELVRQKVQEALESKREVQVEYRVVQPDGRVRWMQSQGRVHGSPAGQPDHLMGVTVDITEQRRGELESQRLRSNLAHLTRVNTLGTLSGSLAYELNQPLGIILSNAQAAQELLTQEPPDTAEVQAILADIVKADRRAGEVIERLRALFKGGEVALVGAHGGRLWAERHPQRGAVFYFELPVAEGGEGSD
jgi:PAS domain S-box-containing protein